MNISIFACQLYLDEISKDKGEALDYARENGISTVVLFDEEVNESFTLHDYNEMVKAHGLSTCTLNIVSTYPSRDEAHYQSEMARIKALVDEAEAENLPMIMLVPIPRGIETAEDRLFMRDKIVQGMREVVEYAKDKKVMITAENFGNDKYPVSSIEDMVHLFEQVPELKFCFDIGNFYCGHSDDWEAYETFRGDNIVNVHVKDWVYAEDGAYITDGKRYTGAAIGQGFQHCGQIIEALKADGYDGNLVIELNPDGTKQMIDDSIAFIKKLL